MLTAINAAPLKLRPHGHYTTQTQAFSGPFSGTIQVSRYQKGKTNLDFTEARDSEWQWHQLGHMQVCTSLQTDNRASTAPLSFLQARCPFSNLFVIIIIIIIMQQARRVFYNQATNACPVNSPQDCKNRPVPFPGLTLLKE